MSVDLSSIANIGIVVPDRSIVVDGNLATGTDAMWDAIPNNVHGLGCTNGGQVEVEITDSDQNSFYDSLSDVPFSSSFDWTVTPWDPNA